MLEQNQRSEQFQKVLERFPTSVGKGFLELQNFAFEMYRKKGGVAPFMGFFAIKEDHLQIFRANDMSSLPDKILNDGGAMSEFLEGFKKFLEKLNHDIIGFILIQQAWMRRVPYDEEIDPYESIAEAVDKKDCLMFLIDSADYSFTSIYEKIAAGDDYVVSPEPIEEMYIDKKDPSSPITVAHEYYNFF